MTTSVSKYIQSEKKDTYLNTLRSRYDTIRNIKTPITHTALVQKNSSV